MEALPMKMDVRATAITSGLFWGGAVLTVEAVNLIVPSYGSGFLKLISSIYPGYKRRRTAKQVALGAGYAAIDGVVGGLMFALLYNRLAKPPESDTEKALLRAAS
jgi:hypothetical protein